MARNFYKNNIVINIDDLQILDWCLIYNSIFHSKIEITFNSDFQQILNKYSVNIDLVDINNNIISSLSSIILSNFDDKIQKIPNNGNLNSYIEQLPYFNNKYTQKNHFHLNNIKDIYHNISEGSLCRLRITINGKIYFSDTRNFAIVNTSLTPITNYSNTFTYNQNYNLKLKGYYFDSTDALVLKLNGVDSNTSGHFSSINNFSTSGLRNQVINSDFIWTETATGNFSGSNSYGTSAIFINQSFSNFSLFIRKRNPFYEKQLNSSYLLNLNMGLSKLFGTTFLKNVSSVTETVNIEIPALKNYQNIIITRFTIPDNPKIIVSSFTSTNLGNGKFQIIANYAPTGEPPNNNKTYIGTILIQFNNGLIIYKNGFVYKNSTG